MAWTGKQFKGAVRTRKAEKKQEAEARQMKALLAAHPDGKCDCGPTTRVFNHRLALREAREYVYNLPPVQDPGAVRLLQDIFKEDHMEKHTETTVSKTVETPALRDPAEEKRVEPSEVDVKESVVETTEVTVED